MSTTKPSDESGSADDATPKKIEIADESSEQSAEVASTEPAAESPKKTIEITDFADESVEEEQADPASDSEDDTDDSDEETDQADETNKDGDDTEAEEIEETDEDLVVIDDDETEQSPEDDASSDEAESKHEQEVEELEHKAEDLAETEAELEADSKRTIEEAMREANLREEHDVFQSDPEIDKAVDEIVRVEGDTAIEVEDDELELANQSAAASGNRVKRVFAAWWSNKIVRYTTMFVVLIVAVLVSIVPAARYAVLNTVGVRVQASLTVVDEQTRLPLENIAVSLQGVAATTDEEGMVQFSGMKLGTSDLVIQKRGYADANREIVLGWGSNPLGAQGIIATGEQYKFALVDWQTGEAVTDDAEAVAGENSAKSDESGVITLTIGEDNLNEVEIVLSASGYRDETFKIADLSQETTIVQMVSDRKHAFISNRDGKYDLYSIDADGMNETLIVEATEKERDVPALLHHPSRNIAGFVTSRAGETNGDGFVLDELYIVDTTSGNLERIARSEQLRLIGWVEDTIVFSQVVEGTSAGNPERSKLISYKERTKERTELASANYFNDVELLGDTLYYAVSSFAVPASQAKLFSVAVTGGDGNLVLDKQVWNLFRISYDTLHISAVGQEWYELRDGAVTEIGRQSTPFSRTFVDNPVNASAVWVEIRDGKGTILSVDTNTGEEQVIYASPGLNELLYWVNENTLVYRISSSSETADYILTLPTSDDGEPITTKLRDVTTNLRYYF